MPELTNDDRADKAMQAVGAYRNVTRFDPNDFDMQEVVQDLLGDLQHLADREGIDFAQALRMGTTTHEEEKQEEECGHRPDDGPESEMRCKDCGVHIVWLGPGMNDYETADN
jgi:hypothetical protein